MERSLSLSRLWPWRIATSQHNLCNNAAQGSEWRLQHGKVKSFCPSVAQRLVCDNGVAWVTQAEQAKDVLLRAGEEIQLRPNAKVVMQSMSEAAILRLT